MFLTKRDSGFTLIEIIVVVAIIGILASIVLFSMSGLRAQARDDQRKTDLKRLQLALEQYKSANGRYPLNCEPNYFNDPRNIDAGGDYDRGIDQLWSGQNNGDASSHPRECRDPNEDFIVGLAPDYIKELPQDPTNKGSQGVGYVYMSNGYEYKLLVDQTVEVDTISSADDEFARCDPSCSPTATIFCNPDRKQFSNSYAVWVGEFYNCN